MSNEGVSSLRFRSSLEFSRGRCPTREYRQSGLGPVWSSPGVVECGCREVEFSTPTLDVFRLKDTTISWVFW